MSWWEWNSIWRAKVPPKIDNLMWQICQKYLLIRHKLCPANCVFSENQTEDVWHILFNCKISEECWNFAGLHVLVLSRLNRFRIVKEVVTRCLC
jgi:hypothetical protein